MKERKGLSGSTLKLLAMCSMLADHTAYVLLGTVLVQNGITSVADVSFSYIKELLEKGSIGFVYLSYVVMRMMIGRLAFPIFCFLLVEGFQRTRSRRRYAGRLFLFAVLSELPFDLAFSAGRLNWKSQNVFFTLLIGLLTIWVIDWLSHKQLSWQMTRGMQVLTALLGALASELISCDYGAKGILVIVVLYLFRAQRRQQLFWGCLSFFWEWTAMLAFIPLSFYNRQRGLKLKYVFYAFYPAHLLVLYGLWQLCF